MKNLELCVPCTTLPGGWLEAARLMFSSGDRVMELAPQVGDHLTAPGLLSNVRRAKQGLTFSDPFHGTASWP